METIPQLPRSCWIFRSMPRKYLLLLVLLSALIFSYAFGSILFIHLISNRVVCTTECWWTQECWSSVFLLYFLTETHKRNESFFHTLYRVEFEDTYVEDNWSKFQIRSIFVPWDIKCWITSIFTCILRCIWDYRWFLVLDLILNITFDWR